MREVNCSRRRDRRRTIVLTNDRPVLQKVWPALAAVAVAVSSAALGTPVEQFKAEEYNSSEAVDSLRRQLMKDNYDYMLEANTERPYRYHAESDDGEPPTEAVRSSTSSTLDETRRHPHYD
ncbi:hypothetical protein RR46_01015 [Papilio xuthus]|uniref:Uncharacterized protein n=1 Tax=Papilio xuthus TaxID=66420 RepID=A0A0N1I3S1_PAPXU|nr:hypothetical protein RR46_01015 [Papilio xuthus]